MVFGFPCHRKACYPQVKVIHVLLRHEPYSSNFIHQSLSFRQTIGRPLNVARSVGDASEVIKDSGLVISVVICSLAVLDLIHNIAELASDR